MWVLYLMVQNFGVAVILLTLIVKVASFPLNIKQQRNMALSQLFMPRVQEIQRKYKNNQAKMQEEMAKLQKEGYNPMGGCGPMLLVMLILFGVMDVVYKPMSHLERLDSESIAVIKEIGKQTEYTSVMLGSSDDKELFLEYYENRENSEKAANIMTVTDENPRLEDGEFFPAEVTREEREKYSKFIEENAEFLGSNTSRLSGAVRSALRAVGPKYTGFQGELNALQAFNNSEPSFSTPEISTQSIEKLKTLQKNMVFLGLDLSGTPRLRFEPLIIIPIFALIFSFLQMRITQTIQAKSQPAATMAQPPAMKAMIYLMPLFSLYISFVVPAGAGFYWGISYLFGIAQALVMNKFWPNEKLREEALAAKKAKIIESEPVAKVVDVDDEGNETVKERKLSELSTKEQKEYERKKLEDARREDALKYGDIADD